MKAIWNNAEVAKSDNTLIIEGNHYFPKEDVNMDYLQKSDEHTTCPWKGEASYYHIVVDGKKNENAAWYYPQPKEGSLEIVGTDFKNYISFWHGVDVVVD